MKVDKVKVEEMIKAGYVTKVKHPDYPIYILNYTPAAQFDRVWNDVTKVCRGLIVDEEYNILYRGFRKFFNYEEIEDITEIPDLPFEVYDKLDGSLGILYWYNGKAAIATRGSFASDQAVHATELLNTKYASILDRLDRTKTYLFEIIYPDNHIIINYHDTDDIFLLAILDNETGNDSDIDIRTYEDIFNVVHRYDGVKDYTEIRKMVDGTNKEGFVIKFSNSYRLKMKFAEYFRLHALLCGITEKKILELIETKQIPALIDLIVNLDEENSIRVREMVTNFYNRYNEIEKCAKDIFKRFDTDKEAAEYFLQFDTSAILFNMRKSRSYESVIWKKIKKEIKQSNKEIE